jgi:hypothetical protein
MDKRVWISKAGHSNLKPFDLSTDLSGFKMVGTILAAILF